MVLSFEGKRRLAFETLAADGECAGTIANFLYAAIQVLHTK